MRAGWSTYAIRNAKVIMASLMIWFYLIQPFEFRDGPFGFVFVELDEADRFLAMACALGPSFLFVKYGLHPFFRQNVAYEDSGKYGAAIALKTVGALIGFSYFSFGMEYFLATGIALLCSVVVYWKWAFRDARPQNLLRLVYLALLAWAIVFGVDVLNSQNLMILGFMSSMETAALERWEIAQYLAAKNAVRVIEIAFLGFVVGLLCAPAPIPSVRVEYKRYLSFKYRFWVLGDRYTARQWLAGSVCTLILVGLFSAFHAIVLQGFTLWPFRLIYAVPNVERAFDPAATHYLPTALWSAVPFVLFGTLIVWLFSRLQLTGILPVVALGAFCGLLWSQSVSGLYRPMFLDLHTAAILSGMIIASGFGATANFFASRQGGPLTPPQPPQADATLPLIAPAA